MGHPVPITSHAAYEKAKPMREAHYQKIIASLQVLGKATYEQIADHCGLDRHQVGRRIGELEKNQIVYKPGTTAPTSSGRQAFQYCLTESQSIKSEHPVSQLVNKTKEVNDFIQQNLFP